MAKERYSASRFKEIADQIKADQAAEGGKSISDAIENLELRLLAAAHATEYSIKILKNAGQEFTYWSANARLNQLRARGFAAGLDANGDLVVSFAAPT